MTTLSTKELYAMFLQCDWWKALSKRKRDSVGHCERCSRRKNLQSHHHFYRDNWFDTVLEDLEVLCSVCHSRHHGTPPPKRKLFKHYIRNGRKIKRKKGPGVGKPLMWWQTFNTSRRPNYVNRGSSTN